MPVTDITKDLDARTITITADFAAPVERIWQVYADPRQLERVFGPPDFPATVVQQELRPGGRMHYCMPGPVGERFYGIWEVTEVDEPRTFSFAAAFADESFTVNPELPVSENTYAFTEHEGGTRAVYTSRYASAEALQQVLDMGVEEGATTAINQVDELIA